ncbi:ABC transporter permease [Oleiagrimonas soli]|uniref:Membrane protein n=1 Tax=Oleiagrimonas soli TaxID=1543381 RepID=A0A099CT44_9GAMM|nr:ABC transporter permease [Oleiagrimonas soli]KGI77128.1 membrane protein [Oleiagrimonas soli]MBB6185327.1 putative ABC transport system permease protein [Oleiagrimonas soli]
MSTFKRFLVNIGLFAGLMVAVAVWAAMPWIGAVVLGVLVLLWLALARSGRRTLSVTQVGLSTLRQRIGASSVIVIGIAGVVGVLVALLAMAEGFQSTLQRTGSDDTAIVLRGGSQAELNSVLSRDNVDVITQAAGVARDASGKPIASPEVVVVANLPKKSDRSIEANVQIRGVGDQAWKLRPNVRIVDGRRFKPGLRELVVGQGAQRQFAGLEVGRSLRLGGQEWTVVGTFVAHDSHDSELWGDVQTVASAYRRGSSVQSVTAKLTSPSAFDAFKAALSSDPRLKVDVSTTRTYFAKQSENLTRTLRIVGLVVGIIMAIGAVFGALNTMFAAVATRSREIATLRAIGFRSVPVVVSVMLETLLLAALGGIVGGLVTWLIFNGYTASTLGSNFSQVVFQFRVTPNLLWNGLKWALAIGLIGGLFPAVRAARLPVTTALRES